MIPEGAQGIHFRPTELRLLAKLSDGKCHSKWELLECMDDPLTTTKTLVVWIYLLRKKLLPIGQDIVCRFNGGPWKKEYQHVRLLHSPNTGVK